MVLGDYLDSLFSNDRKDPPIINFPQGQQFNALQRGKTMEHQARADRLIDPNGFSIEHTLHGQRALGGTSFNTKATQTLIEGFNTTSNIQKPHTAIASKNSQDKDTRASLSGEATRQAEQYTDAVGNLVSASKAFAQSPPERHPPSNSYIAQSVPNPIAADASTAIGKDYVPATKSGLGNAAPVGSTDGITCAGSDVKACVTMCQARTFDDGGIGFTLAKNPPSVEGATYDPVSGFTCTPITEQSTFDKLKAVVDKTPQNMPLPGGSWQQSIVEGSQPKMQGNILVAQLKDSNGIGKTARVNVTNPQANYSNIDGAFRQDLNGEAGLGAITISDPPPGLKEKTMEGNTLVMTTNDGVSYSTTVDAGDEVKFQPAMTKVPCSYDAQCKAAGLPTWVDGVARPGAYHCPGMNDNCFDPSTGKYAKVGQLVVSKKQEQPPGPQIEQDLYSVAYSASSSGSGAVAPIDKSLLGSVHFVNTQGQAPLGTSGMDWDTTSYASVGNFRTDTRGSNSKAATINSCESACNNSQSCKGYTFTKAGRESTTGKSTTASCYLLGDDDWPKGGRIYDKDSSMMMRLPSLGTTAPGCPKNVLIGTASSLLGKKQIQLPTDGCGIAKIMAVHENAIKSKNQQLTDTQSMVQKSMYGLLDDETALQNKLSSSLDQMKSDLSDYEGVNKETQMVSQGLMQAGARSEDTKLQLVSDNYHYLLWSILAITLVIGAIRASRN